jgi:dolichol-phosphate mannosyltransferase
MDPRGDRGRPVLARPSLSIVIPVYNEGEHIAGVLSNVLTAVTSRPLEVLVVYDFEGDSTIPVIQRLQPALPGVRLLRNDRGPGVLNALKSGLSASTAPFVVVMMADGSDDPACIDRMLQQAALGAVVVSGSRYMAGGRQLGGPPLKRSLSRAGGLSLHWLAGVGTHDATNNFRLYSRQLLDAVTIESTAGFELALELTVKAHRLRLPIAEVPTTWRDRTQGQSRFQLWRWLPHYLRWYWFGLASLWVGPSSGPASAVADGEGPIDRAA